ELDERLRRGDRPSAARLAPDSFVSLPPCDASRVLYFQLSGAEHELDYRIGNARALDGHNASMSFPAEEGSPAVTADLAVVLRDDLARATPDEAARAVLGYSILHVCVARTTLARALRAGGNPGRGYDFGGQLGPVLVTRDELDGAGALR